MSKPAQNVGENVDISSQIQKAQSIGDKETNTVTSALVSSPIEMREDEMQVDKPPSKPPSAAPVVQSKIEILRSQIHALTALRNTFGNLRKLPAQLILSAPRSGQASFGLGMGVDSSGGLSLSGETGSGSGADGSGGDTLDSFLSSATKSMSAGAQARGAFRAIDEVRELLLKDESQRALKAAAESETKDKSDISKHNQNDRREKKRRRIAVAESPAAFPSFSQQSQSTFPPLQGYSKLQNTSDLFEFIRRHNEENRKVVKEHTILSLSGVDSDGGGSGELRHRSITKLAIWAPSRPKKSTGAQWQVPRHLSDPIVIRVSIHDVATVFVNLIHRINVINANGGLEGERSAFATESVVVFGPRENKHPYTHSEYAVYQRMTQQITRMIEQEPQVTLPQLVDLLLSFDMLFSTRCSVCERILSQEGHIPPVARVWIAGSSGGKGRWDSLHVSCLQS